VINDVLKQIQATQFHQLPGIMQQTNIKNKKN